MSANLTLAYLKMKTEQTWKYFSIFFNINSFYISFFQRLASFSPRLWRELLSSWKCPSYAMQNLFQRWICFVEDGGCRSNYNYTSFILSIIAKWMSQLEDFSFLRILSTKQNRCRDLV